jgi:hypothetical protein
MTQGAPRSLGAGLLGLALWAFAAATAAHELRPGFLELREIGPGVYDILWKVPARGDRRLALDVRLPERCDATDPVSRFTGAAYVERWRARCVGDAGGPLGLAGDPVWIEGLAATRTDVLARVERLDGGSQTVRLTPGTDRFEVSGSQSALGAAGTYTSLGIEHILLGVDHLLFVLGLLWIVRGPWPLVKTITAFTVGHSISLAAATLGWIGVPEPPVNAAIALSIMFVAVEAVKVRRGEGGLTARRPWLVAFGFGLLHGLGFASALIKLGLPAGEVPLALLFFNIGVEIGQIAFVLLVLAMAAALRVLAVAWPRLAETLLIYGVGGIAAFWLIDRTVLMLGP